MAYAMNEEPEATTFLRALFRDTEGVVALSQPRNAEGDSGGLITGYYDPTELEQVAVEPRSTWVGAATRRRKLPSYERGTRAECYEVPALWADVDIHDPEAHAKTGLPRSMGKALRLVARFPLPPSALVDTGHGLQGWWFFKEPMAAEEYEERWARRWAWNLQRAVEAVNEAMGPDAVELDRLDSVWNVDRILRLPGTVNTKVVGKPVPCRLLELHEVLRYGLEDLGDALEEPPEERAGTWQPQASVRAPGVVLPGDDFNTRHSAEEVLSSAGWAHERGRLWRRPGKDAGHSAEVHQDGRIRIYSGSWLDAHPAAKDDAHPERSEGLTPFGFMAVTRHPDMDMGAAYSATAAELEAAGYGTPAAERRRATTAALGDLLGIDRSGRHLALVPAPGAALAAPEDDGDTGKPWATISLVDASREPTTRPTPTILRIAPNLNTVEGHVFYRGKLHMLVGESESGKSWLAIISGLEVVRAGGRVVFVDFEDDEHTMVDRLQCLGATDAELARFAYFRPDEPLFTMGRDGQPLYTAHYAAFMAELDGLDTIDMVVVDGINEALAIHGLSMNQATEVASLYNYFLRPMAKGRGAAVVGIDHLAKDKDARALGHAIGSQHKRAACDVMLTLVKVRTFAPGAEGEARVKVSKDRPGALRARCTDDKREELAVFRMSSNGAGQTVTSLTWPVLMATDAAGGGTNPLVDRVVATIITMPGCSTKALVDRLGARREAVLEAVAEAVERRLIVRERASGRGGGYTYRVAGSGTGSELVPEDGTDDDQE